MSSSDEDDQLNGEEDAVSQGNVKGLSPEFYCDDNDSVE